MHAKGSLTKGRGFVTKQTRVYYTSDWCCQAALLFLTTCTSTLTEV